MSNPNRWRLMPLTLGAVAMGLMVLLDSGFLSAQAKNEAAKAEAKADAKKEAKKDAEAAKDDAKKAEVKAPYVPNIPPIVDQMLGSQGAAQVKRINDLIKANWIANKVNPSDRCSDYEYIRRASLDIIGRIATEKEIADYMKQPANTRRAWVVERLLKDDEFGAHFGNIWSVMLLTRTGSQKMYQNQMREWLSEQFNAKDADWSKIAFELVSATGKSNENAPANFVAHHIGDEIRQDDSKKGKATPEELKQNGRYDMVPVTSRTTRLFLGLRTQCVQCHDHPFNGEWQQNHFWGVNAYFRGTTVSQRPGMMMQKKKVKGLEPPQIELHDEPGYNEKGIVSFERRSGVLLYTGMQFLDGNRTKPATIPTGSTRRKELAKQIVASPYFSKVYVNRTWGMFFGKSFTKDAPDDFGEHNPASNQELLDYLAEEFKSYNHDPRQLIRWICNSQAYGLSSRANKTNDKPDDEVLFARMLLKSMSPEQLFESLMTATASKIGSDRQAKLELREKWLDTLVLNFGNDEGEEGTFTGTVVQALMLMNGKDINDAIMDQNIGTVANVIKEKGINQGSINKLYLAALNRPATTTELAKISDPRMRAFYTPGGKGRDGNLVAYYQDVFWALLNSNEFILNH